MRDSGLALRALAARHRRGLVALASGLVFLLVIVLWVWGADAERRALVRMPADERRPIYEQTRRAAESLCRPAPPDPALADRCEDLADFLVGFPECDDECRHFAQSLTLQPSR